MILLFYENLELPRLFFWRLKDSNDDTLRFVVPVHGIRRKHLLAGVTSIIQYFPTELRDKQAISLVVI